MLLLGMLAVLLLSIFSNSGIVTGLYEGYPNITNISVLAKVNISNTPPNITSVIVDDQNQTVANQIDLLPATTKTVFCNATIFDFNGAGDIDPAGYNATLFINSIGPSGATDNNFRYRNTTCNHCVNLTATTVNCGCAFAVQYYANYSSSWKCNFSVRDLGGTSGSIFLGDDEVSAASYTINQLLAINTSSVLDFGNLSVTQTSPSTVPFNVTNAGNVNFNLTLRGWGGINEFSGMNNSMECEFGNISRGNLRYAAGSNFDGIPFDSMTNLTYQANRTNLTIYQRLNDANHDIDENVTHWRLSIPTGVGGVCNGTIVFGAILTS